MTEHCNWCAKRYETKENLGARMAQLLEALTTDPRVRGSSQTSIQSEESRQISVIPGIGITRCGHI